jgi:glycosyltransferase involved in cell wall biosynthesis
LSRRWFPCWGDAVIAISQAVEDHLRRDFKIDRRKIFRIETGIALRDFVPGSEGKKWEYREEFHLGNGPVIGLLARLSDVKGQDILIEAMRKVVAHIPEVRLLLVGQGKMEDTLRSKARDLNLDGHIHFVLKGIRRQKALALFDIFVMPSRQEGLGLSIMEAQAFGLPVIASRVGGIPSLIEDGKTGILVEPENPEALAQAIIQLLNNRPRMQTIAAAGKEFIKTNFSAECMMDKVIQLYERVIGR